MYTNGASLCEGRCGLDDSMLHPHTRNDFMILFLLQMNTDLVKQGDRSGINTRRWQGGLSFDSTPIPGGRACSQPIPVLIFSCAGSHGRENCPRGFP